MVVFILNFQTEYKRKKATINPKNKDDKCLQYVAAAALHYGETESQGFQILNNL